MQGERMILILTMVALVVFTLVPSIDIVVSSIFVRPGAGFWLANWGPLVVIHDMIVPALAVLAVAGALGSLVLMRLWLRKNILRKVLFVLLSFALGPGLIVNIGLKNNWGRARPSQVTIFEGSKIFTPALKPSTQTMRNGSFVSGDASAGFGWLSIALLCPIVWRRKAILSVVFVGSIIGGVRIMQGGHFLSDVIFSGLATCGVVVLLYRLMINPGAKSSMKTVRSAFFNMWHAMKEKEQNLLYRLAGWGCVCCISVIVLINWYDAAIIRDVKDVSPHVTTLFGIITRIGQGWPWFLASGLMLVVTAIIFWWQRDVEKAQRWRKRLLAPIFFLVTLSCAGIVSTILKFVFGRPRPKIFLDSGQFDFVFFKYTSDFSSFPSGHVIIAFTAATALSIVWPRYCYFYMLVAVLCALSRVMVGQHYPADIVAGAYVGWGITLLVERAFTVCGAPVSAAWARVS